MHKLSSCLGAVALVACASQPAGIAVPSNLVPAGEHVVERLAARGVQIYECRNKVGGTGTEWVFVAPEADLLDTQGAPAGRHYAGPHWEAADGSRIIGTVKSRADAPLAGAIPWLLLSTRSVGGPGRLAKITSVQRVNTAGGAVPAASCDAASLGRTERVPYTADYILLAP
ncbi:DUF3455 domain-containing protein [Rhizobacter sp. SG703]|uniref:DUF3455 domain-containing protein n=1 Tax=Rhizobacter sp. SG703 TaxID=2587140 RepID=UPI0014457045|nr:DUF3455 domain-containing protein [Rhizobacter sp. SG703]NKI95225.1 hypothetical protein [Rhizobacter sp. SG703]